jgi:PhnB protein
MVKQSLSEQLDQAIEIVLANPRAPLVRANARLKPLVRVARELADLPRKDFKTQLQTDLERRAHMTSAEKSATSPATQFRKGFHTLTPYLVVRKPEQLIEFVKRVFDAEETLRAAVPGGGLHAEVRIGDSMVMMGGYEGMPFDEAPAALHVFPGDVDSHYQRALEAGATSIQPPADQDYGERVCSVKDPFGNEWYIAQALPGTDFAQGLRSVNQYLHPRGAAKLMDFVKKALGAEEVARYESPEGAVLHARVRLGDSILEMGEAHGPYQPMPSMIYMYVDEVDAVYRRALAAGAQSMQAPADQPYGDRNAHVKDPCGNSWYIATPIKNRS